jgi:hypothetical protein
MALFQVELNNQIAVAEDASSPGELFRVAVFKNPVKTA